ncbi:MAG TPA: type II toxin-antitoxin system HicA family toxin [Thermoanaerobaculia bacterium]|nr:type II toxin-antitoxin system HicA family toxin [Thermoanaerobaculia bacterium]
MPPLPVISGADCIKALERVGYKLVRQKGSHAWLECPGRPPVPVPLHKTLDRGTLRSILRVTRISVEEFVKLLA